MAHYRLIWFTEKGIKRIPHLSGQADRSPILMETARLRGRNMSFAW